MRTALAWLIVLTASVEAKPLAAGMKAVIKAHVPHIVAQGIDVAIGETELVPYAVSITKVELSDDGASIVVSYQSCDEPPAETLTVPLASVEAKVENALGMQAHLKKDYAAAIPHFKIASAKDPQTALYATNLLSAQSMKSDVAGADETLATYGPRNAAWFAWRLDVDDELANVKQRPKALALAAAKPGHAVTDMDSYAYSPYGGGMIAAQLDGVAPSYRDAVIVDVATGHELVRIPLDLVSDHCELGGCDPAAEKHRAARRKSVDRVLARLGFEKVGTWLALKAGPVKSPDGAMVIEGGDKLQATIGGQTYEWPLSAKTVGVVPRAIVILANHRSCEGYAIQQTLQTAELPADAPATKPAAKPAAKLDCTKATRLLTKGMERSAPGVDVDCAAGHFGEASVFAFARGRTESGYTYRYATVRPDGTVVGKITDSPMSSQSTEDSPPTFEAADLDGDGTDEVIEELATDRHAIGVRLGVLQLQRGVFVEILGPWLSLDNSNFEHDPPTICQGTLAIEPKQFVITMPAVKNPDKTCLAQGRHAFTLRGGKLVELH